jgi:hypothetical protein
VPEPGKNFGSACGEVFASYGSCGLYVVNGHCLSDVTARPTGAHLKIETPEFLSVFRRQAISKIGKNRRGIGINSESTLPNAIHDCSGLACRALRRRV